MNTGAFRERKWVAARIATRSISFALLVLCIAFVGHRAAAQILVEQPQHLLHAASEMAAPLFKKDVDLVIVQVSVIDRSEKSVIGLEADQFAVFEDRTPQSLKYFSHEDTPIALAVVLDASASMAERFEDVRFAAKHLFETSNADDEIHVIVVGDSPKVAIGSSESPDQLEQTVEFLQPDGQTALWDSIVIALGQLRNSSLQRKAIVVISDGGDNHSRTSERKLKSVLQEAGVGMYAIALYNPFATRKEEKAGPLEPGELTSVTGGRVLSARDRSEAFIAINQISRDLRDQYVLGYYPTHPRHDGKWHKVRVSLSDTDSKHFRVFAKNGYLQR